MSKGKVLVVDGEEAMRNLLRDVLVEVGYDVKIVSTGEEAIKEVEIDEYAVVITDLWIRGMSGLEILKKIRQINTDICVIIITAYPSVESAVEAMRHGAYDYISKPFNIEEIKLVFQRAAERQHLLKEAKEKEFYRELSILDGLTGVYNHRHLHEVLSRELVEAERYNFPFSLLMIDIDNFKEYNDTHGHLEGDLLLKKTAQLFVEAIRSADMVFRYGGEEFAIILTYASLQGAVEVARRLLNLVRQDLSITISIGISSYPQDGRSKNELVAKADQALYHAKQLGKNRICIFGERDEDQK